MTPETAAEILRRADDGEAKTGIATEMGIDRSSVSRTITVAHLLGVRPDQSRRHDTRIAEIVRMLIDGVGVDDIADDVAWPVDSVRTVAGIARALGGPDGRRVTIRDDARVAVALHGDVVPIEVQRTLADRHRTTIRSVRTAIAHVRSEALCSDCGVHGEDA